MQGSEPDLGTLFAAMVGRGVGAIVEIGRDDALAVLIPVGLVIAVTLWTARRRRDR
jgi:hypothetical protein